MPLGPFPQSSGGTGIWQSIAPSIAGGLTNLGLGAVGSALGLGGSEGKSRSYYLRYQDIARRQAYEHWRDKAAGYGSAEGRRIVALAKRAGVHPIVAMGVPQSGGPSVTVGAPSAASGRSAPGLPGQDIGRAVSAALDREAQELRAAELEAVRARSQNELSQAAYYDSLAARERQSSNVSQNPQVTDGTTIHNPENYYNTVQAVPDRQVSQRKTDPSMGAGNHAFWREYNFEGRKIILPFNEEGPSEAIQSTPVWMWPMIIEANKERYGKNWDFGFLDSIRKLPTNTTKGRINIRSLEEAKEFNRRQKENLIKNRIPQYSRPLPRRRRRRWP